MDPLLTICIYNLNLPPQKKNNSNLNANKLIVNSIASSPIKQVCRSTSIQTDIVTVQKSKIILVLVLFFFTKIKFDYWIEFLPAPFSTALWSIVVLTNKNFALITWERVKRSTTKSNIFLWCDFFSARLINKLYM